ncbi:MotA/TolQ/ExbB proton channel family protein [Bdellovibrionales bacterium]|nr:MotA/TolQ/ExbB proton channel family protein [Bdellovibrionales bacterium]
MKYSALVSLLALTFTFPSICQADGGDLDQLLKSVKNESMARSKENMAREKRFISDKLAQAQLLSSAKKELKKLEAKSNQLNSEFSMQEKKLTILESDLNLAVGTLGEMFGVVRQVSGDLKGQVQNSVVSAEILDREAFASRLAESKALPAMADLEHLWFELQREMTESGKITQFKRAVISPSGEKKIKNVTRVGSFNLVADGKYLSYQEETKQVLELPRQPEGHFLSMVEELEGASSGHVAFGLDPSRGSILSMLIQAPNLSERVQQGGLVGYVILALLALGLGLVVERFLALQKQDKVIKEQLASSYVDLTNPIGQMIQAFENHKDEDIESIELKLDEIIIKNTPTITRGIPTIKLLSAVAPLLGLLGTVTGMIVTFQSITLFGTGDPKLMAGGISQALVTTVLGLVCAIPLLLLHNWIANKSQALVHIMEEQCAGLISKKVQRSEA